MASSIQPDLPWVCNVGIQRLRLSRDSSMSVRLRLCLKPVRRGRWWQSSQSVFEFQVTIPQVVLHYHPGDLPRSRNSDPDLVPVTVMNWGDPGRGEWIRLLRVQEAGINVEQPDLCVLKPEGVSFVEVKRDPDRIRPPQQVFALLTSVLLGVPLTLYRVVPVGKTVDPAPITYRSHLTVLSESLRH